MIEAVPKNPIPTMKKFEVLFCFDEEYIEDVSHSFSKNEKREEMLSKNENDLVCKLHNLFYAIKLKNLDIDYLYQIERLMKVKGFLPMNCNEIVVKFSGYFTNYNKDTFENFRKELEYILADTVEIRFGPIFAPSSISELSVQEYKSSCSGIRVFKYVIFIEDKQIENIFGNVLTEKKSYRKERCRGCRWW